MLANLAKLQHFIDVCSTTSFDIIPYIFNCVLNSTIPLLKFHIRHTKKNKSFEFHLDDWEKMIYKHLGFAHQIRPIVL